MKTIELVRKVVNSAAQNNCGYYSKSGGKRIDDNLERDIYGFALGTQHTLDYHGLKYALGWKTYEGIPIIKLISNELHTVLNLSQD